MAERSSGNVWQQENVPSLVPLSDDEENEVEPEHIDGVFPWRKDLCFFKNFEGQVATWRILEESYRSEAFSAMKKILLSPFMFQKLLIPEKWLIWAKDMDMIDYTVSERNSLIKTDISRHHYLAVRMIDLAMTKLTEITKQNRNAVGILKIIWKIREYDFPHAISFVADDRLMKEFAKWLTTCMKGYVTGKDAEYVNTFQRQVLVSLLCWRQFSEVIYIITSEGRDIVREVKKYYNENRDEVTDQLTAQARIDGNYHYGNAEYHMAFQKYSDAINKNPFVAVLYSNRCQASVKLKDFKTAVCDGYRAVLLKPGWVKVNYRLVNCLNLLQYYDEAIEVCRIGLEQCKSDPDIEKLHSLYNKLRSSLVSSNCITAEEVLHYIHGKSSEENAQVKKKSRKKKGKRKLRRDDIENTKTNLGSVNSNNIEANEGKTNNIAALPVNEDQENQSPIEIKMPDKEQGTEAEKETPKSKRNEEIGIKCETDEKERENEDKLSTSQKTKEKEESVKTDQKTINSAEKENLNITVENDHDKTVLEAILEKLQKTEKPENCMKITDVIQATQVKTKTFDNTTTTTRKERKEAGKATIIEEYVRLIKDGSSEMMEKRYVEAAVSYDHAIELVDKKIFSVNVNDYAVLLYARGTVSLMQDVPCEFSICVEYYMRIIRDLLDFEHRSMVHYGLAHAFYMLNCFYDATKEVLIALELIKSNPANRLLNWPGSKTTIPESDDNHLSHKLQQLLQQCRSRPRPDALCLFEECLTHYQKKEIYQSDIHFEGYIVITCYWKCKLHYHPKCWLGLKEMLNISGDKEILDKSCLTPDCQGKIILYEKLDSHGICSKKIISKINDHSINSSKKENKTPKTKFEKRTSKSHLNLVRRLKAIESIKKRKRESKNAETDEIQRPPNINRKEKIIRLGINPEHPLSDATIYLKHDEDDHDSKRISKGKIKLKANKRSVPVSFQLFCSRLPGYRHDMSMHEIDEAMERARESGNPFQLPDDLRQEIQEFESALSGKRSTVFTEEERMKVPFLFEYFQDFLSQRGPLKIDNKLFNDQVSLLPPDWQDVISKSGGLLSFLNSSSLFMLVPPFIGTKSQLITMKQMVDGDIPPRRDSMSSRSSSLDFPMYSEAPLSAFAEEFYRVGAQNNVEDIQDLIGGSREIVSEPRELRVQQYLNSNSSNSAVSSQSFYEDATSTSEESFNYNENEKTIINDATSSPTKSKESCSQAYELLPSFTNSTESNKDFHQNLETPEITHKFCHVATQTENDEMGKAQEAVKRLQERLEVMETTCTKLKRTSQIREDSLGKQLDELRASEKAAHEKAELLRHQSEVESAKINHERKALKEKMQMAKAKETECENSVEFYKEKLRKAQEERGKDAILIMQLESMKQRSEDEKKKNLRRAIKAELDLVKKKQSVIVGVNNQAKSECIQVVKDFERAMTLVGTGGIKAGVLLHKLAEGRECWLRNVKICGENIDTLDSAYLSITDQIESGVSLSVLPQVPDLHPPPPGPSLQHIMHFRQGPERSNGDGPVLAGRMAAGLRPVIPIPVIPNGPIRAPQHRPALNSVPAQMQNIFKARQPIDVVKQQDEQRVKKSNFQILVSKLCRKFPNISKEHVEQLAQQVRAENGGLSGLLYEEIEQRIAMRVAIKRDKPSKAMSMNPTSGAASTSWNMVTNTSEFEISNEADLFDGEDEDVLCPICCDPLYEGRVHTLECEHRFHYECINKWMQKQRTCPNCRKFMSDPSDFPSLADGFTPAAAATNSH